MNGIDPKIAILIHESAVSKKACWVFIVFWWSIFDKKNSIPNITVIIDEIIKVELNSL